MILTMPAPGNFDMLARQVLGPKVSSGFATTRCTCIDPQTSLTASVTVEVGGLYQQPAMVLSVWKHRTSSALDA